MADGHPLAKAGQGSLRVGSGVESGSVTDTPGLAMRLDHIRVASRFRFFHVHLGLPMQSDPLALLGQHPFSGGSTGPLRHSRPPPGKRAA